MKRLTIVLLKPSKYQPDGYVQRFATGFMPNASISHIASLTPSQLNGVELTIEYIDEYTRTNLDYLSLLRSSKGASTLLALVGVQSHQFHRAIDLAAYARHYGIEHIVIGGPHPMTCNTEILHDKGISFSLAEAEVVWKQILEDATTGGLRPIYGRTQRWATAIEDVEFRPPPQEEVNRHWAPMVGYYPVRGCPFSCNFCSVIKIAGRRARNPSIDSIIRALKTIKKSGIDLVMFTSDNFNKFPEVYDLLNAMISEKVGIRFFFQADTQIAKESDLIDLISRAGGLEMFLGVESFDAATLKSVKKHHNKPETYSEIISGCRRAGIRAHFSNILGFPHQTEAGFLEHLSILKSLSPEFASFYILTPIPGTEQYQSYLNDGLIYENNLDRFDSYTPTFRHELIAPTRLRDLLFHAYSDFYKDAMKRHRNRISRETRNYMVFCRWSAARRMHPMSSGAGSTRLDRSKDYLALRNSLFDVGSLLPLPNNLELSKGDMEFNKRVDWKMQVEARN